MVGSNKAGSVVSVYLKNGKIYNGTIIKRYEFADQDYITLKLENGYNISIKKDEIEKIEEKSFVSFKLPKISLEKEEKNITIISTGGTITSRVDYITGGVEPLTNPENFLVYFPELVDKANFEIINAFSKLSEDIEPKDWIKLSEIIFNKLNEGIEGVIVTHGTDTLHYSAAAISFMIEGSKPIAFTAAQRSSDRPSTDAIMNMIASTDYVLNDFGEVAIIMHKSLNDNELFAIRGVRAKKMHSSRRDTFRPINDLPIAEFYYDLNTKKLENLKIIRKLKKKGEIKGLKNSFEEKVALIKYYPGFNKEIIDLLVDKGFKGIVIEGTGFGHVSTLNKDLLKSLERAAEELIILMTTQTTYGSTNSFVYSTARKLSNLGILYGKDMLSEVAFVKLGWLLSFNDKNEVKKLILKNFVGEIKENLNYKEFLN